MADIQFTPEEEMEDFTSSVGLLDTISAEAELIDWCLNWKDKYGAEAPYDDFDMHIISTVTEAFKQIKRAQANLRKAMKEDS